MYRKELSEALAEKMGLTKRDAYDVVGGIIELIGDLLIQGEEINLSGLGKFTVKESPAHVGRNPLTGESVDVPARKHPKFSFSLTYKNNFKAEVNKPVVKKGKK